MPKLWAVLAGGALGCACGTGTPEAPPGGDAPARLSGNWHGSCAIDEADRLWCWGAFGGPSGDPRSAPTGVPHRIGSDQDTWRAVAVGTGHACAIAADGSVVCWGHNCVGQLGDGTHEHRVDPVRVRGVAHARVVAVGGGHSCVIDDDGALTCWGGGDFGQQQCGDDAPAPPRRLPGTWIAVSSHYYATYALRDDGSLWRWVDLDHDNVARPYATGVRVGSSRWQSIAAGVGYVCGLREDGRLACVADDSQVESEVGTDLEWSGVIAASYHACALAQDGSAWCWGPNSDGQLGIGVKSAAHLEPVRVVEGRDWVALAAGGASTCGRKADGSVWCWGANESGELGIGDWPYRPLPSRVGAGTGWRAVTVGYRFSCALGADDALACWGTDGHGQLGTDESFVDALAPQAVPGAWQEVAAASFSACAIDGDGALWCWGGLGGAEAGDMCSYGGDAWSSLATGEERPCVIDGAGAASCWGEGYAAGTAPTPLDGAGALAWRTIASSYGHACGVLTDGTLRCWGKNAHGELGTGDTLAHAAPVEVAGGVDAWLTVATANGGLVAAGGYTCAISDEGAGAGRLYCWGSGAFGRLGRGDEAGALLPQPVGDDADWVAVSTGPVRACAIKADGAMWCWGRNDDGGLGVGAADGRVHALERVGAARAWAQVAVRFHTCATAVDGGLWCWGWGGGGELGDGSAWRLAPARVAGL